MRWCVSATATNIIKSPFPGPRRDIDNSRDSLHVGRMADNGPEASPPVGSAKMDPVLRNAIRYTISAKEYRTLHEYLLKQSPTIVRSRAPQPSKYDAAIKNKDDYNAAAVRASLRVFLAAQTSLKLWDIITDQILRRGSPPRYSRSTPETFLLTLM